MGLLEKIFGNYSEKEIKKILPLRDKVLGLEEKYSAMTDDQLRNTTETLKSRLNTGETLDDILPDAFAVCREASWRVLSMKHFPVQILGGIVLHQGRISEMKTGEGKTLVATLPAYLNALSGKGVHIVTVNDYLAKRDSEWMGKVYKFLGLTVGLVIPGMKNAEKKEAYAADITYCTNNELGFDYLRDNMVIYKQEKVQRGHNFAIVDEVDSILIDEARTPLIISGQGAKSSDLYLFANKFARGLKVQRIKESDNKKTDEEQNFDCDYIVDEKAKTCTLTPRGVEKAEQFFKLENLNDPENITVVHHINQAIRAHGIMKRDVDYIVKDGEVLIIDEFTGRIMYGRRYNEGLHQAIEAKEGVTVARESKTLATITFQNFFRLYDKLAGMTGTALTEEAEFQQIYKLDVIEIPTNKPIVRIDSEDLVYKSERGKFNAVIDEVVERNKKGQPVLVGTISIEKSEELSSLLKKRGIKHNVLNAKYHSREAEIIAQAGKPYAVTIATNMAGRGTDIMLGGNAEFLALSELKKLGYSDELIAEATGFSETDDADILGIRKTFKEYYDKYKEEIAPDAEAVKNAGGLCIIGTERHESRRIDNQLRGRAGRQGDPGESRFYVSLEDDLMRLFGGERVTYIMDTLRIDENTPIQTGILSRTIETAQERLEARNFGIRRNVIQYDDVMNKQRELIYAQRDRVLDGENLKETVRKMIVDTIDAAVEQFANDVVPDNWNLEGLRNYFLGWLTTKDDFRFTARELEQETTESIADFLKQRAEDLLGAKEKEYGSEVMREIERVMLLRSVDNHWMDHIDAMDELRNGMGLRAYGQRDPVVDYRNEGFDMFSEMTEAIREDTAKLVLCARIERKEDVKRTKVAEESNAPAKKTVRGSGVVGRNSPCPCGSGKKYKQCCGKGIY